LADDTLRMRAEVGDGFTGPLAKLRNDLRSLSVSTRAISDGISKDWKGVGKEFGNVESGIKRGLLPTLRGIGVVSLGVSAAIGGVAIGMRNFASGGRDLKFAADQLNMSMSKLRELHNLGDVFDISGGQMNAALKTLQDNLNQLVHNWGAAYNELRGKNLGWIADDLKKAAKEGGVGAAFEKLLEDIKKIPDPVYQRQIAQMLLGGEQFVPMARELTDKIRKMAKDNSIIPPDFDKQSERYIENLKRIEQQLNVMKVEVGSPLLGYLSEVLEGIQGEVRAWSKIIDQVKKEDWKGLMAPDPEQRKRMLQNQLTGAQSRLKDLDEGIGDAKRSGNAGTGYAELQRRQLLDEIEKLRKAVEESNKNGSLLQKQSFTGAGFGGARIMNASLGGGGFGGSSGGFRGTGGSSGGGAATGGPLPDVPGGVVDRTRFDRELQQNPGLREKIMGIAAGENMNPRANIAVLESMMNRAAMAGTTLAAQARLHASSGINEGGYYAGFNPGALRNPKTRAMIENSLKAVLGGSNVSNYATDNSSGSLAAREKATGTFNLQSEYGGESFFSPGTGGGRGGPRSRTAYEAWRNRIAAEAAIPMPRATPSEIRGSARLDINLKGLPAGSQVRSGFDGMFREMNINRGRPMQTADDLAPGP
jgi:hypothetical protein